MLIVRILTISLLKDFFIRLTLLKPKHYFHHLSGDQVIDYHPFYVWFSINISKPTRRYLDSATIMLVDGLGRDILHYVTEKGHNKYLVLLLNSL